MPSGTKPIHLNSVEPVAFLKFTLEAIAVDYPKNRIDELLPLSFKAST